MSSKNAICLSIIGVVYGILVCGVVWYAKDSIEFTISFPSHQNISQQISWQVSFDISSISDLTWRLYITPNNVFQDYISLFDSNPQKLDMYMYNLTYDKVISKIKTLATFWTKIRIILEEKKYQESGQDFKKLSEQLKNKNIQLVSDDWLWINFQHSKVLLFDNFFLIQTANLTYSSFFKNREHVFYWENKDVLNSLEYIFNQDFQKSPIDINKIHSNLLVCPINCRLVLETFIKSATKSIYIQNQYITDEHIQSLLKGSSVEKKIILADKQADNVKLQGEYGSGMLKLLGSPYPHSKTVLIDDKYLIISSINFSANSMDSNREIGIITTDTKLIDQYKNQFEKDRKKAK